MKFEIVIYFNDGKEIIISSPKEYGETCLAISRKVAQLLNEEVEYASVGEYILKRLDIYRAKVRINNCSSIDNIPNGENNE